MQSLESEEETDNRIPWVRVGARWRRMVDGGGCASYGRLLPEDRPDPPLAWMRDLIFLEASRRDLIGHLQKAARRVDTGFPFADPFPHEDVCELRALVCEEIVRRGRFDWSWLLESPQGQPFFLNLLTALGKLTDGVEKDVDFPCGISSGWT